MGFLSMCGLMKVEDHASVKRELATANADIEKSAAIIVRQKSTIGIITAERDKALKDLAIEVEVSAALHRQMAEQAQKIAALTPDAEATRKRRANDAKRVRPSRAKKAPAAGKAAPKAKAASIKAPR